MKFSVGDHDDMLEDTLDAEFHLRN